MHKRLERVLILADALQLRKLCVNLPELLSEQQITKWLQSFLRQIGRYVRTVWRILHSPTSLVRQSMHDRSIRETKELIAPLPFALLTLVFATLLGTVADITVGVNEPFSGDLSYYAVWRTYGHWITSLQK